MIAYLDANIVIYLVEQVRGWEQKVSSRLTLLRNNGDEIAVSDEHRLECLVGPLILGSAVLLASFAAFFADPGVRVLPVTAAAWERAAHIRAARHLKPLDSLHLATAIEHGCGLFLTNDAQLAGFPDIPVEILT